MAIDTAPLDRDVPLDPPSKTAIQAVWLSIHTVLALGVWALTMVVATLMHPDLSPPVVAIVPLALAFLFPFLTGLVFNSIKPSEAATLVWMLGLIWFMLVGLIVLNLPTGPSACYHCGATQKLWLTFFDFNTDSNLLQGQGRFLGLWPAVALIGYGFGARLGLRGKNLALLPY
jgi:hypothetical protein